MGAAIGVGVARDARRLASSGIDFLPVTLCRELMVVVTQATYTLPVTATTCTAATDRSIPFVALAQETRLPVDQVEWVLMRAMSLGLIKGRIDQVDSVVHITFVKPRVLDKVQVAALQERVENWRQKAHTALVFMEEQTQELLS